MNAVMNIIASWNMPVRSGVETPVEEIELVH